MKYAIIENGTVTNIAVADAPLADNWIEAGSAKIGDTWDGTSFTSPPLPPAYATADEAKAAMVGWIDRMTAKVLSRYPESVRVRWPEEEAAARAVKADTATPEQTTLITDEGAAKGRTPAEHADIIIGHAENFHAISGEVNKLFLSVDAALDAETDPAQYEVILEDAKTQAQTLAAAYGLG